MKMKYKNDILEVNLWSWILCNILQRTPRDWIYRSTNLEFEFNNIEEYWIEVGKRGSLVHFISSKMPGKYGPRSYNHLEIMQRMARLDLGDMSGVVISNIDHYKLDRLLLLFPGVDLSVFRNGEMIIFPTQNKEAARKLTYAIPEDLADVVAFADGHLFQTNGLVENME